MLSIVVTKQDLQTKTLLYQCSTRKFCTGVEAFATTLRTRLQACYGEFSKEGTPTHDFKSAPQGKFEPTKKAPQLSLQIWSYFFVSSCLGHRLQLQVGFQAAAAAAAAAAAKATRATTTARAISTANGVQACTQKAGWGPLGNLVALGE